MFMPNYSKIIEKVFKKKQGKCPVSFRVHTNDERQYYVIIMVDISRMDKNGPNYDENYRKLFQYSGEGMFKSLSDSNVVSEYFNPYKRDIEQGLNLWEKAIQFGYNYENYSYFDKFEVLIDEAIKGTAYPDVLFQFSTEFSRPFVNLMFYNIMTIDKNKFMEQLSINLSGVIDLTSYEIFWSSANRPPKRDN